MTKIQKVKLWLKDKWQKAIAWCKVKWDQLKAWGAKTKNKIINIFTKK